MDSYKIKDNLQRIEGRIDAWKLSHTAGQFVVFLTLAARET